MGTVKQLIMKASNQAEFVKIAELPGASPPGLAGELTAPPRPQTVILSPPDDNTFRRRCEMKNTINFNQLQS